MLLFLGSTLLPSSFQRALGLVEEDILCLCCCFCSWDLFLPPSLSTDARESPAMYEHPCPVVMSICCTAPMPALLHPSITPGCCSLMEEITSKSHKESFRSTFQQVSKNFTMMPIHWRQFDTSYIIVLHCVWEPYMMEQELCPFLIFFKVLSSTYSLVPHGGCVRMPRWLLGSSDVLRKSISTGIS